MVKYKFLIPVHTDLTTFDSGSVWKLEEVIAKDGGYTAYIFRLDDNGKEIGSMWGVPLLILHCCCEKIIE